MNNYIVWNGIRQMKWENCGRKEKENGSRKVNKSLLNL